MLRCPFCGYEGSEESFKLVKGHSKFRFYNVKMFGCPKCYRSFNYYHGVSTRTSKS